MQQLPIHPKFKESDFACKCGTGCGKGYNEMSSDLLKKLFQLRDVADIPLVITSAYRCAKHKETIKRPTSAHTQGEAVDIKIQTSGVGYKVLVAALSVGFNRIGWNQDYDFFHIDCSKTLPQNVLFKY